MHKAIIENIKKYESIVIFRHILPDMDAYGSQMGLALWIGHEFPEKKVYLAGGSSPLGRKLSLKMDDITEEILDKSLGIVTDTSNKERVDDTRFDQCAYTIRIDHHMSTKAYCDYEWVEPQASAASEMIALFLKENGYSIPDQAAQYLYMGMTADNIRFTISSVRPETFDAAKYLLEQGADVIQSEIVNFSSSLEDYQYESKVRYKAQVKNRFMYSIMDQDDYLPCGMDFANAKEKVYVLAGVSDITIWALFTMMDDGIHYSASLRSREIIVRDVAEAYNGGGHNFASGIKNLTIDQVEQIVDQLTNRS